jgi:O-antigen/teichoic acid export membrane protein
MGFIQKDAFRTTIVSYLGLILGYINKGVLFILFLSTEQIGLINLLVTVGFLFSYFSHLGTTFAIWKFTPFFKNHKSKNGFLQLNLIITFFGILIFSILAILFKSDIATFYSKNSKEFVEYYFWIIPIGIGNCLFLVFESYLRSLYKNVISVFVQEFFLRFLISILLIIYAMNLISFHSLLVLHCLFYFIPMLILAIYLFKIKELRFSYSKINISKKFKKIIVSFSLFSYLNSVGTWLVISMDAMMIAAMMGLKETGVYTTIIYLSSALLIPYRSIIRITSPLIADYWKDKNRFKMQDLYQKVSSISLILGSFMFLIIWINRIEIFSFLPAEFQSGIWVFFFLMMGRLTDMYCGLNGAVLITSKKFKVDLIFTLALLGTVFVLNYILIPIYGIVGAAISTGIGFVIYNVVRIIYVNQVFKMHPFKVNQVFVFSLTLLNLLIFEILPTFFEYTILSIGLKLFVLLITFVLPIFIFKLDPELLNYFKEGKSFISKKILKTK